MVKNNLFLQFFLSPGFRLYRHFLLLLFTALVIYYGKAAYVEPVATYGKITGFAFLLALFYANMYWLVPRLLFRNKYVEYVSSVLLLTGISYLFVKGFYYFIEPYAVSPLEDRAANIEVLAFIFIFTVLTAASAAVKLFQRWVADNRRIVEFEKATMLAEMEQLKSQINPHFLLNMLNNANVLTKKDPARASAVLMKMSKLLRYQLYDSKRSKVLLAADIEFLGDLLDLEKTRRDDFTFVLSQEGNVEGLLVPPLLFVMFVENAVKHSMDSERPSYVHVHFQCLDGRLHFRCFNSKPSPPVLRRGGGLGLANVQRRLQLAYNKNYTLEIKENERMFDVVLIIKT